MASENNEQRRRLLDEALNRSGDPAAWLDLSERPRIHETIIKYSLLLCGIISILTTLGIVVVLGNESLSFFTRQLWELTNRPIAENISAQQTQFVTGVSGANIQAGDLIRLNNEMMDVTAYERNQVVIDVTGTGGGFSRFCAGETDLNNASRPITEDELATCRDNGVNPIEFRIGTDALAITVNGSNEFAQDVTVEELRQIFTAEAWNDVRPDWPDEPIMRFIPGTDSGTFDYFVEEVFDGDEDAILNPDPITSEDDNQLTRGIRQNEFAVGFFGYAYYRDNNENLNILDIESTTPNSETVDNSSYTLARPLFIYVNEQALKEKQQIAVFVNFYLNNVDELITKVGYFPASDEVLAAARQTLSEIVAAAALNVDIAEVSGSIQIAGSSTVFPVTQEVSDQFQDAGFLPRAEVVRGVRGSRAVPHSEGTIIEKGDNVTLFEFFTNTVWQPAIGEFGIIPLVYSTLATSFIAMLVALPLGIGAAIYLSEYAAENVRATLKPILEILAGIPTVVYGYFALTFMTPLLRGIFGQETVSIFNVASAGIVVGILIIPLVSSMSEDALRAVPRALREASYGLGANKLETTIKVVLPAALSGIIAAFIIAISRAIGETMIVAIAAGSGPLNNIGEVFSRRGIGIFFESAETMTGHIARISGGDLSYDSIDYNSIFAIGLALFVITLILNLISRMIINRFREAY